VNKTRAFVVHFAGAIIGAAFAAYVTSGNLAHAIQAARATAVFLIKTRIVPRKYRDTDPEKQQ
jgi:hypothetical protein